MTGYMLEIILAGIIVAAGVLALLLIGGRR